MYHAPSNYRVFNILMMTLMSTILLSGCGHRAVHGSKHMQKGTKVSEQISPSASVSSQDKLGNVTSEKQSGTSSADGGRNGINEAPFNDLLAAETFGEEDGMIKELSPADLAQQYWRQRQQAALATDRSGIEDVLFELDSWELTDEAKQVLTANAELLKSTPSNMVTIEGHCDERGTRAYNYVLGKKRALRTRNYLASLGVSPDQLTIMSYGKDNPICRQTSESCYDQNRRAHFLLGIKVADARP